MSIIITILFFPSMQQKWMCVALLALLVITVTLADGGKTEKQGKRMLLHITISSQVYTLNKKVVERTYLS